MWCALLWATARGRYSYLAAGRFWAGQSAAQAQLGEIRRAEYAAFGFRSTKANVAEKISVRTVG